MTGGEFRNKEEEKEEEWKERKRKRTNFWPLTIAFWKVHIPQ